MCGIDKRRLLNCIEESVYEEIKYFKHTHKCKGENKNRVGRLNFCDKLPCAFKNPPALVIGPKLWGS